MTNHLINSVVANSTQSYPALNPEASELSLPLTTSPSIPFEQAAFIHSLAGVANEPTASPDIKGLFVDALRKAAESFPRLFRAGPLMSIAAASVLAVDAHAETVSLGNTIDGYTTEGMPGLPNYIGGGFYGVIPITVVPTANTTLSEISVIGFGIGSDANPLGPPDFSEFKLSISGYSSITAFTANATQGDLFQYEIPNQSQYFTYSAFGNGPTHDHGQYTTYKLDFNLQSFGINLASNDDTIIVMRYETFPAASGEFWNSFSSRNDLPPSIAYLGPQGGALTAVSGTDYWPGTTGLAAYKIEGNTAPEENPTAFNLKLKTTSPLSAMSQSGFYSQQITLHNDSTAQTGFKLEVMGLPPEAKLYNCSGMSSDNLPFLQVDQPLAADGDLVLTLQYYIPVMPASESMTINFKLTDSDLAVPNPSAPLEIKNLTATENGLSFEFPTTIGEQYTVQYSPDLKNWEDCVPITAASNKIQWTGGFPPETSSAPSTDGKRFYRVRQD